MSARTIAGFNSDRDGGVVTKGKERTARQDGGRYASAELDVEELSNSGVNCVLFTRPVLFASGAPAHLAEPRRPPRS